MSTIRLSPECMPSGLRVSPVYKIGDTQEGDIMAGAILPDAANRRPLGHGEMTDIFASSETVASALVEVFPTPLSLLTAARDYSSQTTESSKQSARRKMVAAAQEHGGEYLFARDSSGNSLTTTRCLDKTNLVPGLHVDNRDNLPLSTRTESRRRMGVNIGPGRRWLLVCFPDILQIAHEFERSSDYVPGNKESCINLFKTVRKI